MNPLKSIDTPGMAFYVSPEGNDDHPGTVERPFKTIERARDTLRERKKEKGAAAVYLRGGTYELSRSICLKAEDSGSEGNPAVFTAYPGEEVFISGGRVLKGWERVRHEKIKELWKLHVPDVEYARQLYVNGRLAERPRTEYRQNRAWDVVNDTSMQFCDPIGEFDVWHKGVTPIYGGYRLSDGSMAEWVNQQDIEFIYDVGWTHVICPVEEIRRTETGAVARMRMPCFRDCQIKPGVQIGAPNYIENVFELMEKPGQWYFDRRSREIFYIPLEGEEPESTEAVLPMVETLLEVKGAIGTPVQDIVFRGLCFVYSSWLAPGLTGHAEIQSNLIKDPCDDLMLHSYHKKTASAVVLEAAHGIVFEGCTFSLLGSNAIDMGKGSVNNEIRRCEFKNIGGSGIQIGEFSIEAAHPAEDGIKVKGNLISDNLIHHIGIDCKGGTGILAGYTEGTQIRHNEICNTGYIGISLGWGWGFFDQGCDNRTHNFPPAYYPRFNEPTSAKGNRIEYNHIHHVLQRLHDGAGIYTLSMQPDSVIRGNHVHDNGGFSGKGYEDGYLVLGAVDGEETRRLIEQKGFPGGIYMDECSGGFDVYENIVYNVAIPCFFHDAGLTGGPERVSVHDNWYNISPEDSLFPGEAAAKAGIRLNPGESAKWGR